MSFQGKTEDHYGSLKVSCSDKGYIFERWHHSTECTDTANDKETVFYRWGECLDDKLNFDMGYIVMTGKAVDG